MRLLDTSSSKAAEAGCSEGEANMRKPAQVADVDGRARSFRAADVGNHAILNVTESTMWSSWPEALEADVHRSLEAHEGVVAGLVDLLKRVA
jgi:hypothetical protein